METIRTIRDGLFWMAPRIVIASRSLQSGVKNLQPPEIGAALILDIGIPPATRYYLATARHLVEDALEGSIMFLRSWEEKTAQNEPRVQEYRRNPFAELWYFPQNRKLDLAIAPMSCGELGEATDKMKIGAVPLTFGFNRYLNAGSPLIHGFEEVLFIGYPEGLWDPASGFPIVRRGVTATSLKVDYRGEPVFLVDGAVHPGCSGGPVVILEQQFVPAQEPSLVHPVPPPPRMVDRFAFLGMITDVLLEQQTRQSRLNLGVVLKSHKLFETIREYERLTGAA